MGNANVSVRMEEELKAEADAFFGGLGLTLSAAVNVFVRQCLLRGKIPFEIEADPFWSQANQRRLREAVADIEAGRRLLHQDPDALLDAGHD